MLSRVFEQLKGKNIGEFTPTTIYSVHVKTKKMLDLAQGVTLDMSDIKVTLKKLEIYVYLNISFLSFIVLISHLSTVLSNTVLALTM